MKIHLTKKTTINPLTFILTVLLAFTGQMSTILSFVPAMFFHELAHILTAKSFGLSVDELEILPFGARATISGALNSFNGRGILVSFAGPFANIIFAAVIIVLSQNSETEYLQHLMFSNLSLAALNMLPCLPLDGGNIIKNILTLKLSQKTASKILCAAGILFGTVFMFLGLYIIYTGTANVTFFIFGILIILSALIEFRNIKENTVKSLIPARKGEVFRTHIIAVKNGTQLKKIINSYDSNKYNLIYLLGNKNEKIAAFDEYDITNMVLKHGIEYELLNTPARSSHSHIHDKSVRYHIS